MQNNKIGIFTDSSSDISRADALRYDIAVLPVQITYADKTISEHYDITPEAYWELLLSLDEIPTTAQVSLVAFTELFEEAKRQGKSKLLGILINGQGSGTYSAACTARELFYEQHGRDLEIEIIDSRTYTFLYGHVVLHAAELRRQGCAFDRIAADARARIDAVRAYLGVYSLKHLKKSGRISGGAAFVGEALGLRPVSLVGDGGVKVSGKVRGDKNVVPEIIRLVKEEIAYPEEQTVYIVGAKCPEEEYDRLTRMLKEQIGPKEIVRVPMGPSVATNAGPLCIAVAFYCKRICPQKAE